MYCSHCGGEVDDHTVFCVRCGQRMAAPGTGGPVVAVASSSAALTVLLDTAGVRIGRRRLGGRWPALLGAGALVLIASLTCSKGGTVPLSTMAQLAAQLPSSTGATPSAVAAALQPVATSTRRPTAAPTAATRRPSPTVPQTRAAGTPVPTTSPGKATPPPRQTGTPPIGPMAVPSPVPTATLLFGPATGKIAHSSRSVAFSPAPVHLTDFVAEARFYNPYDGAGQPWDYGFIFREDTDRSEYRLIVTSGKRWVLTLVEQLDGKYLFRRLGSGDLDDLDVSPSGSNLLRLAALGGSAQLYVNGKLGATLDVSDYQGAGRVEVATGFYKDSGSEGATTRYEGFKVWAVTDPTAPTRVVPTATPGPRRLTGPDSGRLAHKPGQVVGTRVGLDVRDFTAQARFYNPYDRAQQGWDYGFAFRAVESKQEYRLMVDSDQKWTLTFLTFVDGKPQFADVATGHVANLDVSAAGSNVLRLVSTGPSGQLYVNGQLAATLDLSQIETSGDISYACCFVREHARTGASTRYEGFTVWAMSGQ